MSGKAYKINKQHNDMEHTGAEGAGIVFKYFPEMDAGKRQAIEGLWASYSEWNSKINVISRKDIEYLYLHHVLHSLAIAAFLREKYPDFYARALEHGGTDITMLDFGTGGGFPGIPLAILFPGVNFTLCDSVGKKIKVAQAVADAAGLKNVVTANVRGEELKGRYDFVISRAVTSLDTFLRWIKGKYTKGIIYLKGGDMVEELTNAAKMNRLLMSNISAIPIDKWFSEEYFSEKRVIFICK